MLSKDSFECMIECVWQSWCEAVPGFFYLSAQGQRVQWVIWPCGWCCQQQRREIVPVWAATVRPQGACAWTHTSHSVMPCSHKLLSNWYSKRRTFYIVACYRCWKFTSFSANPFRYKLGCVFFSHIIFPTFKLKVIANTHAFLSCLSLSPS